MSLGQIIRQRREQLGFTQDHVAIGASISKPYLSNIETGKAKNPPSDGILVALEKELGFGDGELTRIAHLTRTPVDVRHEHELLSAEVQKLRHVLKKLLNGAPRKEIGGMIDLDELSAKLSGRGNVAQLSAGVMVPVINRISAGYPRHFTDLDYPPSVADDYIRCPDLHDARAFAARVVGDSMEPKYLEGDIVVFSPAAAPNNGDDCFVRFADGGETTFKRYYQDDPDSIRLQPLNDKYAGQNLGLDQISGLWPAVFRIERLRGE